MGDPYPIVVLKRKRDELSGEILRHKERLKAAQADLEHIDHVLRIMGYDKGPSLIQPIKKSIWLFKRGELKRLILDIQRKAGRPLSNREFSIEVIHRKGRENTAPIQRVMDKKVRGARRRIGNKKDGPTLV